MVCGFQSPDYSNAALLTVGLCVPLVAHILLAVSGIGCGISAVQQPPAPFDTF